MSTYFFNGSRSGNNYHAAVIDRDCVDFYEVEVRIFSRKNGVPYDSFTRTVPKTDYGHRSAVRAVIANPDDF